MSSLNKVVLIGRITADPELRQVGSSTVVPFNIACDRNYKDNEGNRPVDFISCEAWNGQANFIGKYCHKGSQVAVVGSLRVESYDTDNGKRYKTYVKVDEVAPCGGTVEKTDDSSEKPVAEPQNEEETPSNNDDLPF